MDRRAIWLILGYLAAIEAVALLASWLAGRVLGFHGWAHPLALWASGVAIGLGRVPYLATSAYVAFGDARLRSRLAVHAAAYAASIPLAMLSGAIFWRALGEHHSLGTPQIVLRTIAGYLIVPAVMYCLQPFVGLLGRPPVRPRRFALSTILLATAAIAVGFAFRAPNPGLWTNDLLPMARDVVAVLAWVSVVLGSRFRSGLALLLASIALAFVQLYNYPTAGFKFGYDATNLAWSLATWVGLLGLFLILRVLGVRLVRGERGAAAT
ncbi:MAG: hypothetical protein U0836_25580 [Pirellulales bacterium]